MQASVLDHLETLELDQADAHTLAVDPQRLALTRAWPRSSTHLLLEYASVDGTPLAGQWMANEAEGEQMLERLRKRCATCCVKQITSGAVVLQTHGADHRLVALTDLVADADTRLVSHRPGRRAVVQMTGPQRNRFVKVVRPARCRAMADTLAHVEASTRRRFDVPAVLACDETRGTIVLDTLAGEPLLDRSDDALVPALQATGAALRSLHEGVEDTPLAADHDRQSEIGVVQGWLDHLAVFRPEVHEHLGDASDRVRQLLAANATPSVMIHRDFYDKQVFMTGEGRAGFLDFDTLARGEAALDVANMIGHLELRCLQGKLLAETADAAARALVAGYQPSDELRQRMPAYLAATRLRLVCVYAFRPVWASAMGQLIDRLQLEG